MAENKSQWPVDNSNTGASAEAEDATPKFSGDDIEFESFMFDGGGSSSVSKGATATATAPAVTLEAVSAPGYTPDQQPNAAFDAEPAYPAFSFDASGPIDVAPVDPADMPAPMLTEPETAGIAGEAVPMPSHLQATEPDIPAFVPEVPIRPAPLRTTGALSPSMTGPMLHTDPSMSNGSAHSSGGLRDTQNEFDGWTDSSLSVVEDFSSVLLAMHAGSHFPPTSSAAVVLDPERNTGPMPGMVAPAYEGPTQSLDEMVSSVGAPQPVDQAPEETPQVSAAQMEMTQQVTTEQPSPAVQMQATAPAVTPLAPITPLPPQPVAPQPSQSTEPSISEGQFAGAEMEFESFMFTEPVPNAEAFKPALADIEKGLNQAASHAAQPTASAPGAPPAQQVPGESVGSLPFWLQTESSTSTEAPNKDNIVKQHGLSPASELHQEGAKLEMTSAPPFENSGTEDYLDLPPITPFDFSLLGHVEEEEQLGFNSSELDGMIPTSQVSTKVTTDLGALAELLGLKPAPDTLKYPTETNQASPQVEAAVPSAGKPSAPDITQETDPGATLAKGKGTSVLRPEEERSPSWTSTVTSGLESTAGAKAVAAADAQAASTVEQAEEFPPPVIEPFSRDVTDALNAPPDMEIDPFDYSNLDLDDSETATEQLSNASSTSVLNTSMGLGLPTTPVLMPLPDEATSQQLQPWMEGADAAIPQDNSGSTSVIGSNATRTIGGKSTGWLSDTDGKGIEEDMAARTGGKGKRGTGKLEPSSSEGTKARVARATSERKRLDAVDATAPPPQTGPTPAQPSAPEIMPQASGSNYEPSGPLPVLSRFSELQQMAEQNPDDLSMQMALASAFAQSGELDPALRIYRRILKKRNMSPGILAMIVDELADVEAEARDLPRYHQVLGDLYMKQGLYKEAIEEYNKMG